MHVAWITMALGGLCLSVGGVRKPQTPPVWEYHYQYELFEKIYDQTQHIQRQIRLNGNCGELIKACPDYWLKGDGLCYFLPPHWKLNWHDAQKTCERLGGNLAVLDTESRDLAVSSYIRGIRMSDTYSDLTYVWIGGFDFNKEGDWMWVNGRSMNYSNWAIATEDDTDTRRQREDCLGWNNGLVDNNCAIHFHFVCEKTVH